MFPFTHMLPYTDYHDVNLDWLIREVEKIKTAEGISFDDTINIDADNVQSAIEKIKELIDTVSAQSQKIAVIDNDIPDAFWVSGYVYNHMQTINQPTVKAIIDAMIDNKVVILKSTSTSGYLKTDVFYIQKEIIENTSEYWHTITLYDSFSGAIRILKINGLNDALNVNAEVIPESVKVINAEDVDFSAVTYTADNVKDALVEVDQKLTDFADITTNALDGKQDTLTFDNVPTAESDNPVKSDGIKLALDGKQDALTFDNTPTLGSDNPVTSDGIAQAIQASVTGVVEWNGRSGYVTPQNGDYTASQVSFNPATTSLSPNATTVQKAIEELAPASVTVTLTLYGAKEDSITIYDSNNVQVGSCVFDAGQTSGTCQIVVPVGGGSYKFVSSVTKDIATWTSDYEKTVALSDDVAQTVYVCPDHTYWCGSTPYGMGKGTYAWTSSQTVEEPTYNTNSIALNQPASGNGMWFGVLSSVDVTDYTTLKIITNYTVVAGNGVRVCADSSMSNDLQNAPFNTFSYGNVGSNVLTVDISSLTGTQYIVLGNGESNGAIGTIYAIILE